MVSPVPMRSQTAVPQSRQASGKVRQAAGARAHSAEPAAQAQAAAAQVYVPEAAGMYMQRMPMRAQTAHPGTRQNAQSGTMPGTAGQLPPRAQTAQPARRGGSRPQAWTSPHEAPMFTHSGSALVRRVAQDVLALCPPSPSWDAKRRELRQRVRAPPSLHLECWHLCLQFSIQSLNTTPGAQESQTKK